MPQARPLRPLGGWDLISRGRFEARHHGHVWTVDLDYFDFGEKLHLYRDGVEVDVQKSPAQFELGQSGTAEAWRLRLDASVRGQPSDRRHLLGRAGGGVGLRAAAAGRIDRRRLGRRGRVPFTLPGPANFALGIAALAAALERALRFKSNRWLG